MTNTANSVRWVQIAPIGVSTRELRFQHTGTGEMIGVRGQVVAGSNEGRVEASEGGPKEDLISIAARSSSSLWGGQGDSGAVSGL